MPTAPFPPNGQPFRNESAVAIIPARGGSKRIPKKNIKPFLGKPIIAYSIATALESGLFSLVAVSTDCPEIADTALRYGAAIRFMRPAELADDNTPTAPVLLHALDALEQAGETFAHYCCIYATAPFVTTKYLHLGHEILRARRASTVFSVTSFPYPIFRALQCLPDGRLKILWPQYLSTRSQDLPETCHDAGQFYWGTVEALRREKQLFTANSYPVALPRHLVQDIDTMEDWYTAERMFLAVNREG